MPEHDKQEDSGMKKTIEDTFKSFLGGGGGDPDSMVKHIGQFNLKRLAEEFQDMSLTGSRFFQLWFHQIFSDAHAHSVRMNLFGERVFADSVNLAKKVDSRDLLHVPTHDYAFSSIWTFIDELAASLSAKTGLQQDVVADLMIKVLADVLAPKIQEAAQSK